MESPIRNRKPAQARTQDRVARAMAAAEQLLIERGPEEVSIPDIAEASGVPRASLYQFYANKYQLFAAISESHLARVAGEIKAGGQALAGRHWREVVPLLVEAASRYYNEHPVAGILILGWPMSRDAYLAQEVTIENIGDELRSVFATLSPPVALPAEPDAGTIVTELAFACMKYGYFRHGLISEDIIRQSSLAVIGYLEQVLPPELAQSRPS
ncbi:TetR/AcrR family transcriptional regulator [Amnimonas aquatica]|nr:TetR/AcrR family transcriptional regulator [Amnimonas aquatica]